MGRRGRAGDRGPSSTGGRPDFLPALRSFAPWARWRDTLFVHGGPVPGQSLAAFGAHAERLWIRDRFFDAFERFPDGDAWATVPTRPASVAWSSATRPSGSP